MASETVPSQATADAPAPTLPLISLQPFLSPSSPAAKRLCAASLSSACENHGFFYLTAPPIGPSRLARLLSLSKEFFSLPTEEKSKILRKSPPEGDGARGYQRLTENVTKGKHDFHEAIDFYRPVEEKPGELLMGRNMYPEKPEGFAAELEKYWAEMEGLGQAMMRAMAWALGYEDDEEILLRETDKAFWGLCVTFRIRRADLLTGDSRESYRVPPSLRGA
jgi:isopenicillin N synthase-like dioxygenase